MLIYEYRVRDAFSLLRQYAANVRTKFRREASPEDLLLDVKSLRAQYDRLNQILPETVRCQNRLIDHIGWMEYWLQRRDRMSCTSDIENICDRDIPDLENAFQAWCKQPEHFDSELATGISDLLAHQELDSAIRKAFVILKERLCTRFGAPRDLDGQDLINSVFGRSSEAAKNLAESDRQALRDLLAGLYGVFRNRFAHGNETPSWSETEAAIAMINYALQAVNRIK